MACYLKSILTVFQSYLDDGKIIMKGSVQEITLWLERSSFLAGLKPRTARSTGQRLSYQY